MCLLKVFVSVVENLVLNSGLKYRSIENVIMRPIVSILLCFLAATSVLAQELDTLQLNEIEVYGTPISKYSAGSKVVQLTKTEVGTLNQQIEDELPVYFKTYGNGQLSTVAFRGTSASHTAVLWNGVPVNSPTLGQTDFSLWPSFLIDDVALQFGNSASLYGSGAIGGSVFLESSKPVLQNKAIDLTVLSQVGSFGQFTNGISASYGNSSVLAKTKVFQHYLENDFAYPLKGTDVIRTQDNASIRQLGVSQDIYYTAGRQEFDFHAQLLQNDRAIQPSIANPSGSDELEDINLRLALNQNIDFKKGKWNNTLAFIINDQYFNQDSRVVSQQFSGITNYEIALGNTGSLRIGANVNYFIAETDNYQETDWLTDLYAAFTFEPLPLWKVSLNLRQSIDNTAQPFAPSIGSELPVYKSLNTQLSWKAQASRAYRLPTLNDRFWQPGGNPDLQAEESTSIESGFALQTKTTAVEFTAEVNAFRNWVDEWIIWLPNESLVWSPSNIRAVQVTGVELTTSFTYLFDKHQLRFAGNYSFTESLNESGLSANDNSVGKQLPYVPEHQFNVGLFWKYLKWSMSVNNNYTGARFTTDDNTPFNSVDEFNLVNIRLGKEVEINNLHFNLSIESRNVLDIYYENQINLAMPGRSYLVSLLFNI